MGGPPSSNQHHDVDRNISVGISAGETAVEEKELVLRLRFQGFPSVSTEAISASRPATAEFPFT